MKTLKSLALILVAALTLNSCALIGAPIRMLKHGVGRMGIVGETQDLPVATKATERQEEAAER
ncbi:MAG: hypothetical protein ACQKBY_04055 [Verrucomicrobiales bacterium]